MVTIHKYQLPIKEEVVIIMPSHADIIRIDAVDGLFYIWAVVTTGNALVERTFHLYKTGQSIKEDTHIGKYIGFVSVFVGMELGFYVFESTKAEVNHVR